VFSSRPAVCGPATSQGSMAGATRVAHTVRSSHTGRLSNAHIGASIKRGVQVVTATLLVAGCPVAIVWWLRASGTISSAILCLILGMGLSLSASQLGCAWWAKRPGSEDLLFSELMIWGFLHQLRTQHRLASARDMLGISRSGHDTPDGIDGLSTKGRVKLLERLVAGIETRDPYLHGHSRRVARHSWMIARRMGLPRAEVARIRTAAAMHDVGKIETPKAILHNPGPLSDDEFEVIKRHAVDGAEMAAVLRDSELTSIIRHHHERLDGTGYPSALAGAQIPLGARIIAVADTFDAITSTRAYRSASAHKKAIDILHNEAGTRLDPTVVRAFCSHYAGRRPLVLWASLAGLPERVVSWLGGSVASVTSTAKVLAVTALVSGTAVATSMLALPAAEHGSPAGASRSGAAGAQAGNPAAGKASVHTRSDAAAGSTPQSVGGGRRTVARTPVRAGSPSAQSPGSAGRAVAAQLPQSPAGQHAGAGSGGRVTPVSAATVEHQGTPAGESARGTGGDPNGKVSSGAPVKAEETPAKLAPATPKVEEAHPRPEETHTKAAEAPAKQEPVATAPKKVEPAPPAVGGVLSKVIEVVAKVI
jgi:putative nucleotidyltransferase with HDIG domain